MDNCGILTLTTSWVRGASHGGELDSRAAIRMCEYPGSGFVVSEGSPLHRYQPLPAKGVRPKVGFPRCGGAGTCFPSRTAVCDVHHVWPAATTHFTRSFIYTHIGNERGTQLNFVKKYWFGLIGALVIVVLLGLMVGGVIEP